MEIVTVCEFEGGPGALPCRQPTWEIVIEAQEQRVVDIFCTTALF